MFRVTYAFHARELRFERDAGAGFARIFPETFSFRIDRHDPAEIFLQLDDLARKPRLLAPEASRRDAQLLVNRLLIALPRYLQRILDRLEADAARGSERLVRSYGDIAILAQVAQRFLAAQAGDQGPGLQIASLHLRKLLLRCLLGLLGTRVDPDYLDRYVSGQVDPVDPSDDLSEGGFFHILEGDDAPALNRAVVRLAQRAYFRWLEEVCLDESNGAFEVADSPFESREVEVRRAVHARGGLAIRRGTDLAPFLRLPANRDCRRVLARLEAWFLRQYDVTHAAAVIHHAARLARGRSGGQRVLTRHAAGSYLLASLALAAPFLAAAVAYDRAPPFFDALASLELLTIYAGVLWFLLYRFCWRKDLTFFRAGVPRIGAGIIVGYLPIFFIDEVWDLAHQSWFLIGSVSLLLGFTTLLYIYIEVQRRLGDPGVAFARARQIFLLGHLQSLGFGILLTGLVGRFMVERNWDPALAARSAGQLPEVIGIVPFSLYPSAIFLMSFMAFFIGTFLQLMWEDLPITEPL